MTEETKDKIVKIAKEHFEAIDILKLADHPVAKKAEIIYNELPTVYKKLSDANVLPDGITMDTFMRTVLPRLQNAAQEAHMKQTFGNFI